MQWFGPRRGGMVQKGFGPSEGRGKRAEKREKREERDKHDQDERVEGRTGSVPDWRDGTEKGRPLGGKREESREKREERREKREERDKHDQDERVEGRVLNNSNSTDRV